MRSASRQKKITSLGADLNLRSVGNGQPANVVYPLGAGNLVYVPGANATDETSGATITIAISAGMVGLPLWIEVAVLDDSTTALPLLVGWT